jgi:hypothetical protein
MYVVVVLWLGRGLDDPIRDPFYVLAWRDYSLSLTLGVVVIASWAILLDAPHVWATLARTFLDPDEWGERRSVLLFSLFFFALGPIAILGPWLVSRATPIPSAAAGLSLLVFFAFFRLWAYYHVVRQHWGFLVLYKRRNRDSEDPMENRIDWWFFHSAMYLPLIVFVTAPWLENTGMTGLGLDKVMIGDASVAEWIHMPALSLYPVAIAAYVGWQVIRYTGGHVRNGPKLLFLVSIVPLHLVVFLSPLLALFIVPIVTVGHNLQYHRIVWTFGRRKYVDGPGTAGAAHATKYRWARRAFRSAFSYWVIGLVFTFGLYQGPWVDIVRRTIGELVEAWLVPALGLIAGVASPDSAGVGAQVASALILGWAMQHYYLDSKIWRVRRDPKLAEHLGLG